MLGLLDDDLESPFDSQESTIGLAQQRAVGPGRAHCVSLSLDESQQSQPTAGENILHQDDQDQNNQDGENGL